MHASKRREAASAGTGGKGKSDCVWRPAAGRVKCGRKVLPLVDRKTLHAAVLQAVSSGAVLYTDDHPSYKGLKDYRLTVKALIIVAANMASGVTRNTNGIESFLGHLETRILPRLRSIIGAKKHLSRYVNEFVFKANTKSLPAFDVEGKDCGITTVRAHFAVWKGSD